jgi:predicted amidohydrolase
MRAAVGQLCSTDNVKRNAEMCASIIRRAAAADCQLVLLPEAADFIADASKVKELSQPIDSSDFVKRVREQAKESKIWVGVCVHEATDSEKSYNSSLVSSFVLSSPHLLSCVCSVLCSFPLPPKNRRHRQTSRHRPSS